MNGIKGNLVIVDLYDTTDTDYRPIACLTGNVLDQTREIIETQTKCDPDETIKQGGVRNYSISGDGVYIDSTSAAGQVTKASHDYMTLRYNESTPVTWRMSTGLADTPYYYGTAIISNLSLSADVNQAATFSFTLEGSGAIVTVDPFAP